MKQFNDQVNKETFMSQLGFIGAGNMAEAIIAGCLKSGLYQPADLRVYDVAAARL